MVYLIQVCGQVSQRVVKKKGKMQQKTTTLMRWRNAESIKGSLRNVLSRSEDINVGFLEEATLDLSLNNELVLGRQKGAEVPSTEEMICKATEMREIKNKHVWRIIGYSSLMEHKNRNTERQKRGDR